MGLGNSGEGTRAPSEPGRGWTATGGRRAESSRAAAPARSAPRGGGATARGGRRAESSGAAAPDGSPPGGAGAGPPARPRAAALVPPALGGSVLDDVVAALTGADADGLLDGQDEDLAVAHLAGAGGARVGLDHPLGAAV